MTQVNATYPAGKYYIGDVCYALSDRVYQRQWGDAYRFTEGTHVLTYKGRQNTFTVNFTTYGDGLYMDSSKRMNFHVDSGTIGIVPMNLCSLRNIKDNKIFGGCFIESNSPVEFKSKNGIFIVSYNDNQERIIIDTNGDNDE